MKDKVFVVKEDIGAAAAATKMMMVNGSFVSIYCF